MLEGGRAQPLQTAGRDVVFGTIGSPLDLADAKEQTDEVREAVGEPAGAETFVSGTPAIQGDLDPIFEEDLLKGEAIALPIALAVLLAVFGLSLRRADAVHRRGLHDHRARSGSSGSSRTT